MNRWGTNSAASAAARSLASSDQCSSAQVLVSRRQAQPQSTTVDAGIDACSKLSLAPISVSCHHFSWRALFSCHGLTGEHIDRPLERIVVSNAMSIRLLLRH